MGREEEATHVAVPRGRRPRHQSRSGTSADPGTRREPIRANECPSTAGCRHQVSSQWPVGARDGQTSDGHGQLGHPLVSLPEGECRCIGTGLSSHPLSSNTRNGQGRRGDIWALSDDCERERLPVTCPERETASPMSAWCQHQLVPAASARVPAGSPPLPTFS